MGGSLTDGLLIEAPRTLLQRFPKIRLSGPSDYLNLTKIPGVSARVDSTGGSQAAPASLRRIDNSYEILIDTSSVERLQSDPVRFHLYFDTFFVPKKLGINVDTRELVVRKPLVVQLIR
jgi:hypothetical protein